MARRAAAPRTGVGGDVRRDVDAARQPAVGGARRGPRGAGLGGARHRLAGRRDRSAALLDTRRHGDGGGGLRGADGDRRPGAVAGPVRGLPPGAQPGRLAGVGHRTPDGRRPQLPVPDLRQPAHAVVAAPARRENRPRNRDLDGAAHPEVHRRRGRRLPRRRHHGGVLRARRRLDPRRQGHHRQARVPRQLRDHPAGPTRARRRAGGRAERHAAQGEGGLVVAGQSADPAAPPADGRRRAAHLPPVARGCKVLRGLVETCRRAAR